MKGIVFDLEMNQPSQAIFEIGAYLVNYKSQAYLAEFQTFCKLPDGERLNPEVAALCNVTEDQVNAGVERADGIRAFWAFVEESQCQGNLACWGTDLDILREQSRILGVAVPAGICGYNVLAASKRFGIRPGKVARRGLGSALNDVGIPFKGDRHRACPDSWNLAQYEFHCLRCLERYRKAEIFVGDFFKEKSLPKDHGCGGYQGYLPPTQLENRAESLLKLIAQPLITRGIPASFSYKGVTYQTIGPARMEDALGNWSDGFHFKNEKGESFIRSAHSFYGMLDRIEKI